MATQITQPTKDLYEQDFYAWSRRQAELLRLQRFSDLDLAHLTLEIEDLGEAVYRSVRSRVRTIIEHLLKLEHSPASEPQAGDLKRGWRETIRTQRADLDENLSAALRPRNEAGLPRFYAKARRDAAAALRDYGEPTADALPERVLTPSTGSSATGCHCGASVSAQSFSSVRVGCATSVRRGQRRQRSSGEVPGRRDLEKIPIIG
jgi:hypothetical protein